MQTDPFNKLSKNRALDVMYSSVRSRGCQDVGVGLVVSPVTTYYHNNRSVILWTSQADLYEVSWPAGYVTIRSRRVTLSCFVGLLASISGKAGPLIVGDHCYGDVIVMSGPEAVVELEVLKNSGRNHLLGVGYKNWIQMT